MNAGVRTLAHPMAFTAAEFWRGAWTAWGAFLAFIVVQTVVGMFPLLFGPGLVIVFIAMLYGLVFGGLVSLVAMLLFSPVAWLLGRSLRRVAARWIHLAAFAALGAGVGVTTFTCWTLLTGARFTHGVILWSHWTYTAGAAIAVGVGWWKTSRKALEQDLLGEGGAATDGPLPPRRTDVDSAFEDEALDS